ncbi:hypothetical protein DBR42_01785 [Pelomonas sp. HMWF004]|nr:hypothetical protein DBR42_01785 [Pelomonas sp. HMWF004]
MRREALSHVQTDPENATSSTDLESRMSRKHRQILATLDSARIVADKLQARLSTERDVMDLGDLAHIQTTVKKIEELLGTAAEYEEILRNQLHRTAARVGNLSGLDAANTPQRQLGLLKNKITVPADFDGPLPDALLDDFEGRRPAS